MRLLLVLLTLFSLAPAVASAEPQQAVTAEDGILCLLPSSLHEANQPATAKSLQRLRALGCLRPGPGIRLTVLDGHKVDGPFRIRFYPEGIAAGVMLWGLPTSFKLSDGTASLSSSVGG